VADMNTKKGEPRRAGGAAAGAAAANVRRFLASRQRSRLGLPEMIALAAAAVLLAAALSSYFLLLRPQRARLERLADEQGRLERALRGAEADGQVSESTQASVERILASLQEFEAGHLGTPTRLSTTEVAGELNRMILRHNLHISGGLDFTQFEGQGEAGGRQTRAQQTGASRPVQTVFPGVGIQISVEGPYANLRRFIRDVESQDERFIVINSVELEGVTDSRSRSSAPVLPGAAEAPATPAAPPTSRGGALVSLRLDMAAYFRRGAVAPAPEATQSPEPAR
jgi:Tfp pilus assembly protein PilO